MLGLRISIKAYPEGSPVRDRAHLALLARLRGRVGPPHEWRAEAPVTADDDDLRAWDARLEGLVTIGVDAETRLADVQAVQRRVQLKRRDGDVDRLVLLVAGSHHNRRVLREHREALRGDFPLDTGRVLRALRTGTDPVAPASWCSERRASDPDSGAVANHR